MTGTRQVRSAVHALHDNHFAGLLDQALYVEHLRLGVADTTAETERPQGPAVPLLLTDPPTGRPPSTDGVPVEGECGARADV